MAMTRADKIEQAARTLAREASSRGAMLLKAERDAVFYACSLAPDPTREETFLEAARAVCSSCAGHAFPDDKDSHRIHGPNEAGNYTHIRFGEHKLCPASGIYVIIRWERR